MSPDAERIWNLSEEYVALAPEHLDMARAKMDPNLIGPPKVSDREHVRAVFLFPTMSNRDSQTQIGMIRQMHLLTQEARGKEKIKQGPTAEYTEAMTEDFAKELRANLDAFTPVQQEILLTHYLLSYS